MLYVGIDLIRPTRFGIIDTLGGAAFYSRVFTPGEQIACGRSHTLLAVCFAAKEAVSKLLKTGLSIQGGGCVTCHSIEIFDVDTSEPKVHLTDAAFQAAQRLKLVQIVLHRGNIDDQIFVYAVGTTDISARDFQKTLDTIHDAFRSHLAIGDSKPK